MLFRELKQWEAANETMKDLKANVGKAVPKTFATFGAHSALAAAMIVPVSIAIQSVKSIYVTVRAKTSLVHTSDFAKLMVHKILLECYTKFKFSAMIQ